jgi:hypothetical protein
MSDDPRNPPSRTRRAFLLIAEGLLVLATLGLVAAILLPVWVGPSEQKQRESRSPMRFFR